MSVPDCKADGPAPVAVVSFAGHQILVASQERVPRDHDFKLAQDLASERVGSSGQSTMLEHANGIVQSMEAAGPWNNMPSFNSGNADGTVDDYLRWYADYVTLCNMVNSQPNDPAA